MLIEDSVAYNHGGLYVGRHYRYASVGGHTEIPSEVIREIKRTYSEGSKVSFFWWGIIQNLVR